LLEPWRRPAHGGWHRAVSLRSDSETDAVAAAIRTLAAGGVDFIASHAHRRSNRLVKVAEERAFQAELKAGLAARALPSPARSLESCCRIWARNRRHAGEQLPYEPLLNAMAVPQAAA